MKSQDTFEEWLGYPIPRFIIQLQELKQLCINERIDLCNGEENCKVRM